MTESRLREEIAIQIAFLDATVREVGLLRDEISDRNPTPREIAAAGGFLADFYTGIENILKRICVSRGIVLPSGENWHRRLFKGFCEPGTPNLPILIDEELQEPLATYRRFRHVVHHSYLLQLRWSRMVEGLRALDQVYAKLKGNLRTNLLID